MHFLLAMVMLTSSFGVDTEDACQEERQRADEAFARAVADDRSTDALEALIHTSQSERLCLGEPQARSARLLSQELWAMTRLERHEEARRLAEHLFPSIIPYAEAKDASYLYVSLGGTYFYLGRYTDSAHAYWESIRRATPSRKASGYLHLTTLHRRTHRMNDALAALDSAEVYLSAADDREFLTRALHLNRLDVIGRAASMGYDVEVDRLQDLIRNGHEILEDLELRPNEHNFITTVSDLANAHLLVGDTTSADAMIARIDRHFPSEYLHYTALRARGAYFVARRDHDAAFEAFTRALEGIDALAYNNRVDVMTSLGDLYVYRGEHVRAIEAYLRAEEYAFLEAGQGVGSELTTALYRHVKRAGRRAAGVHLMTHEPVEALSMLDRVSARYLNRLRASRPAADDQLAREIDDELSRLRAEMRTLSGDDLIAARARESALVAELDERVPAFEQPPVLELASLQQRLRANDQVMLVYLLDDVRRSIELHQSPQLLLVTPDTLLHVPLETNSEEIANLMLSVSPVFETGAAGIREKAFDLKALARLYTLLVRPIEKHLTPGTRLVVVPDGPLYHLPFGSLVKDVADRFDHSSARYLVYDHAVSVELSPSLYLDPGGDPARRPSVAALARTRFDEHASSKGVSGLPAARRELAALTRLFGGVDTYRDGAATPEVLFDGLRNASAVHVATHAMLDPGSHLNHAILLSPDQTREDGTVYLFDLIRRDFATPFVAITGCATAAGPLLSGDGMAGFQYAFRSASVGSVLSTHWLVDDEIMASITEWFYEGIARGLPKDEALRQAQLRYLDSAQEALASPFYWAAPVLYGDTVPMQFTPAQSRPRNIAFLGAVLLALVAALVLWRRGPVIKRTPSPLPV
jgi:CHAT domain-containing protein